MVIRPGFFLTASAVIVADQLAKLAVTLSRGLLPAEVVPGLVGISYATNTGIAFGFFQGSNSFLIGISAAVAMLIIFLRKRIVNDYEKVAAALILGGTLGNLIDRVFRGSVVDYFYVSGFPAFNIADVALTAGAVLIIAAFAREKLRQGRR